MTRKDVNYSDYNGCVTRMQGKSSNVRTVCSGGSCLGSCFCSVRVGKLLNSVVTCVAGGVIDLGKLFPVSW